MFSKEVYQERRAKLKTHIKSGVILLMGNEESSINYTDNHYPFRQDSNFLYFFGLDRVSLVGIIDVDNDREILFGNDVSVEDIVWTGAMPSLSDQSADVGVHTSLPLSAVGGFLEAIIKAKSAIHYLPPYRNGNMQKLNSWLNIPLDKLKSGSSVILIEGIVAQRSVKSTAEIQEIERGVNTTIDMQIAASQLAQAGISETEIAGRIEGIAVSAGGKLAFPSIVTTDGQILHNHGKGNILRKCQMLLVDCGAETGMHYGGDLTRTYPVGGKFTDRQKEVYDIVVASHNAAIAMLKPKVLFRDVHLHACETLVVGLKSIGLMKGDVQDAVQQGAHAMFFQCGLGHLMGLDTHDMEDLGEQYVGYTNEIRKSTQFGLKSLRLGRMLEDGFVITIEPGIYIIPELIDMWRSENKFKEFINYDKLDSYRDFGGIRIEEDLLITEEGSTLLGKELSRNTEEIM